MRRLETRLRDRPLDGRAVHVRRARADRVRGRHAGVGAAGERRATSSARSPIPAGRAACTRPGAEEPCAFVGVDAPFADPVVRGDDRGAGGGAGRARRRRVWAGCRDPDDAPAIRCERRHAHVETLVDRRRRRRGVAEASGAAGARRPRRCSSSRAGRAGGELRAGRRASSPRATALGVYDDGYVVIHERSRPVERAVARPREARGARDRCARAAHRVRRQRPARRDARLRRAVYLDRFGVLPGERAVVFTTNQRATTRPSRSRDAGVEIAAIVDMGAADRPRTRLAVRGIEVRNGWAVAGTDGDPRLSAVHLLGPDGERETVEADLLLVSGGWNPVGAALAGDRRRPALRRAAGVLRPGRRTARVALGRRRRRRRGRPTSDAVLVRAGRGLLAALRGPPARPDGRGRAATRSAPDLRSVEHMKRATYIGTALDQGRTSGVLDRRDREPGARRRTRRAGSDERAAAVHAGLVRGARRARPRSPVRSGRA